MKKYFLYSKEQHRKRTELEKRLGRKYTPGSVFINGENHLYTEINTGFNNRFKDTVTVYYGEVNEVKYTKPSIVNLRG